MTDLDRYQLAEDQAAIDAGEAVLMAWCYWCKTSVPASEMVSEFSFDCKACEAKFEADCAKAEELRKGFGGEPLTQLETELQRENERLRDFLGLLNSFLSIYVSNPHVGCHCLWCSIFGCGDKTKELATTLYNQISEELRKGFGGE